MSGSAYLEGDCIVGWVPQEIDSEMEFHMQDICKGVPLGATP